MPYNNDYNKKIAADVRYIAKRFIEHTDALGTANTINYINPAVGSGGGRADRVIGGGVGCAEWKGASADKHEKDEHAKCPCGGDDDEDCMCGGTKLGHVPLSGGAILGLQDNTLAGEVVPKPVKQKKKPESFGSLGSSLSANLSIDPPEMPSASAVRASAVKDPFSPLEAQSRDASEQLLKRGRGRPKKSHTKDETSSPLKVGRKKKGGNGFASGTHMDTGEGPATLGVKSRKKGGAKHSKRDITVTKDGDPKLPTSEKVTVKSTPKKTVKPLTEKSQLPSSTLSGFGKSRIAIVKQVMAEKGLKLCDASKYVKEHGLYKKKD